MYYLKTENSFDSAHFLKGYNGKCRNLHGHRWRVVVEIAADQLKDEGQTRGMLEDFSDLNNDLEDNYDFDHSLIYEKGALKGATIAALQAEEFRMIEVGFRPTAEHFSKYFYELMSEKGFPIHRVEVYETPNNLAAYEE